MEKKIEDQPQLKELRETMVQLKEALAGARDRIMRLLEDKSDDLFN